LKLNWNDRNDNLCRKIQNSHLPDWVDLVDVSTPTCADNITMIPGSVVNMETIVKIKLHKIMPTWSHQYRKTMTKMLVVHQKYMQYICRTTTNKNKW
jgi:hypothetical protein